MEAFGAVNQWDGDVRMSPRYNALHPALANATEDRLQWYATTSHYVHDSAATASIQMIGWVAAMLPWQLDSSVEWHDVDNQMAQYAFDQETLRFNPGRASGSKGTVQAILSRSEARSVLESRLGMALPTECKLHQSVRSSMHTSNSSHDQHMCITNATGTTNDTSLVVSRL